MLWHCSVNYFLILCLGAGIKAGAGAGAGAGVHLVILKGIQNQMIEVVCLSPVKILLKEDVEEVIIVLIFTKIPRIGDILEVG